MLKISTLNSFNQKSKIYNNNKTPFESSEKNNQKIAENRSPKNLINIIPNNYADEFIGALLIAGITILSIKNGKTLNKLSNQLSTIKKNNLDLTNNFNQIKNNLTTKETFGIEIGNIKSSMEAMKNSLRKEMTTSKQELINDVSGQLAKIGTNTSNTKIPTETVNINGKTYNLATIFNPLKQGEALDNEFKKAIQTASTERIFGLGKVNKIPENGFIRIVSFEAKPFNMVGGMATVPKEIAEELPKLSAKTKNSRLIFDTPLYTGRTNMNDYWNLIKMNDGSYAYQKSIAGQVKETYKLNLIDEFDVPIINETPQHVRLFQTQIETKPVEFTENMQKQFTSKLLDEINAKLNSDGIFENGSIIVTKKGDKTYYQSKVTYNLWDNEKFALDVPLDVTPNNYTDKALKSGLMDRAVFFCKYIYEHTYNMANGTACNKLYDKSGKEVLSADAFILNDWHTGPLAAMMRLNPIARHYQQGKPESIMNKLANMKIITLLHNTYDGQTWDKKQIERMLNVMFDENTAKIVPNAYMPNTYKVDNKGLPMRLGNSCMIGDNLSCLNMIAQYSDSIHPVSKGFSDECKMFTKVGDANNDLRELFVLRSKDNWTPSMIKKLAGGSYINLPADITDAQLTRNTFYGIDNGLNKLSNILTQNGAKAVNKESNLIGTITPFSDEITQDAQKALEWKTNNKKAVINYFVDAINQAKGKEKSGPMNAWFGDTTNLTGVTVDTPIFTTAGRYTKQKGLETYIGAIEQTVKNMPKGDDVDYPVFIIQGAIDKADSYTNSILDLVKKAKENLTNAGYKKAADRIVVLDRGDGAKYTITKLLTDSTVMASEYEPCGLTQKEFMNASGALCVGHDTGGICSGLKKGINIIGVNFNQNKPFNEKVNNLSNGFKDMLEIFKNQRKYGECVQDTLKLDFTWTKQGGSAEQYIDALFT